MPPGKPVIFECVRRSNQLTDEPSRGNTQFQRTPITEGGGRKATPG